VRWLRTVSLLLVVGTASTAAILAYRVSADETPAPLEVSDWDRRAFARLQSPPLGLPVAPLPEENTPTLEKIALGRKLFFDRRLSFNNTMSCGMCHIPEQGFTNNELATPVGVEGRSIRRNSPTVLNSAYLTHVFHDGREISLENQVLSPLVAHDEMANPSIGHVIAKIRKLPDYDGLFEQVFGGGPSIDRVGKAIATWERTLLAGETSFDRWYYLDEERALTDEQKAGFELFTGKARCVTCHSVGPAYALFTDDLFHDTGIGFTSDNGTPGKSDSVMVEIAPGRKIPVALDFIRSVGEERQKDLGRFEVTLDPEDKWRFKTPSLRNVAVTAPYMHDGSLKTTTEVIRFYVRGGIPHEGLDPLIQPLSLSEAEIRQLNSFLESLTSPTIPVLQADARSAPIGN
jgi:cytochrome c peroxidase